MIASTCSRAAWGLHTVAASSMDAAALSTTVCTPCPGFDTLRVFTRCLLSSSVTSLLTADGSRDSAAASAKRGTAFWLISCRSRTRAGVITSRKSAGSSKDRFTLGASLSARSSLRALARMRKKNDPAARCRLGSYVLGLGWCVSRYCLTSASKRLSVLS